jgi:hypothetical protein
LLGVAVTVAELPAESVVALAVIVGVTPFVPFVPFVPLVPLVPAAPVAPRGIANASVKLLPLVVPVTVALPLSSVVVLPINTVVAGPAGMPMSSFAAYAVPASFFTYACDPAARVVTLLIASVPETTVAFPGETVPTATLTDPPLPTVALTFDPPDTATLAAPAFVTLTVMSLMVPSVQSHRSRWCE